MSDMSSNFGTKWHDEIPGTRWFRADLHLHTLDDFTGGNIAWPGAEGIATPPDPADPATRAAYVRRFLRSAIAAGIDVLGLTPHSAHFPGNSNISIVWDIVEAWQTGSDDDGCPFREKIYAVFPGFEPSASDGKGGIHLLLLFDADIGKDRYTKAFTVATGGQDVWRDGRHQTSTRSARELMQEISKLKTREGSGWDYLFIAPHAFSDKGVVESLKGDLGKYFEHGEIAALELKDNHLPQDAIAAHPFLSDHLKKYCQALIHGSDAYGLVNGAAEGRVPMVDNPRGRGIGYRYTLVKLASPRIESLRQAFLSSDSRLCIVYQTDSESRLQYRTDLPHPVDTNRSWLRSLTIEEGTSFFAGKGKRQVVRFSPDLTCIIGGRMTGKSTLLDGLRTYLQISLPEASDLVDDVQNRAARFLSGNPTITLDILGPVAPTLQLSERWPARFFTQRELARIAKDAGNVQEILYRLAGGKRESALRGYDERIVKLDDDLTRLAETIGESQRTLAETEQAFAIADKAKQALTTFAEAGIDSLSEAQADHGRVTAFLGDIRDLRDALNKTLEQCEGLNSPNLVSIDAAETTSLKAPLTTLAQSIRAAQSEAEKVDSLAATILSTIESLISQRRATVQKHLVDQGRKPDELNQFSSLSLLASAHETAKTAYDSARRSLMEAESKFMHVDKDRDELLMQRRSELAALMDEVNDTIKSVRILPSRAASRTRIDEWIRALKEAGITRWWNDNPTVTDAAELHKALVNNTLRDLGMSETVAMRFTEHMTSEKRYQLRAMRSEDSCQIEARVGPGDLDFRPLNRLSGGKQISVLLSLLLESTDTSPLIIDQPEDELDKAFLAGTLLPILRRLKGRRQIVFATHDANIVVNGDADHVVHLEAEADSATIRAQGAIDNQGIRQAILTILDGGRDAFELRKRKYGF